jgi:ASPIC and UnbV/FG-GAP-like repeat
LQGEGERSDGQVPATIFQQTQSNQFEDLSSIFDFDLEATRFGTVLDLVGDNALELILLNPREGISIYDAGKIKDITDEVLDKTYRGEDFIAGDFNGDLLSDLYITKNGLSNSAFNAPDSTSLNLNLMTQKDLQGITWKTEGKITIELWTFGFEFPEIDPEDIFIGASAFNPEELNIPLGQENETITELTLTLDPEDPYVQGLADFNPGEEEGLYIGYDTAASMWELQLSTPDKDLVAAIIKSENEITDAKAIAFNNDLQPIADQLLLNDGSRLVDRTNGSGINSVRTAGVSTVAGDFDNDMDLDLYVVTTNAAGNEPNVLYDNQGDGIFKAVVNIGDGAGSNLGIGDTVSTADYNNDGFLDLFITNGGFPNLLNRTAPYELLENEGNDNHWLEIDLEGVFSNRDGIGAKVYVTAGGVTQIRQQTGGMHNQVQNDARLHFGLAENIMIEEIKIEWSSGIVQSFDHIAADQILNVVELGNG